MCKKSRTTKNKLLLTTCLFVSSVLSQFFGFSHGSYAQGVNKFKDVEIRVIRPRYFNKKFRLELGGALTAVMNQNFIYSYLGSGLLSFHFAEWLGLEVLGSYGFSVDKSDKSLLEVDHGISTLILRNKYDLFGSLVWTPIYGKYQLSSGRLIYFDTFLTFGAGLNGVEYIFDHCEKPEVASDPAIPTPFDTNYFGFQAGIGQRFFLSKKTSVRWDVRGRFFTYDKRDGDCLKDTDSFKLANTAPIDENHTVILMQLGMSYFL